MTKLSGIIAVSLGVLILLLTSIFDSDSFFIAAFYSVPLIIVGLVIIFRKSEDAIEQINYGRLKNNGKK